MAIKLPNDVTKLSGEALATLLTGAQEEFDTLLAVDEPTEADVTEAERLDSILKTLRSESDTRSTAAADRTNRMDVLRTQAAPIEDAADEQAPEEIVADGQPVEQTSEDGEPEGMFAADGTEIFAEDLLQAPDESDIAFAKRKRRARPRPGQQADDPNDDTGMAVQTQPAVQVATTAGGGFVAQVARNGQRPQVPARAAGRVSIRAAADVPEVATGSELTDMTETAKAVLSRMQGFPAFTPGSGIGEDLRHFGVATFRKPFEQSLIADGRLDAYDVIMNASKEVNLPGGSLTAAGGWCAPSEVIYDLCQDETTDGMLSIAEIQVTRGGIKYTQGPDFSTIYDNTGFCQTEAQAIAGTTKPCYTIPCPDFEEVRLDACGVCIKVPILTNSAYPELVARVLSGAMIAHQHQINAKVINSISTALGASTVLPDSNSSASGTLNAILLITESLRSKYRLGFNRAMEVVAPHWLLGAIKADLAARMGVNWQAITDAQVNATLTGAGAAVQWVEDWQGLPAGCPTGWPATVDLMIYPSGTFVKGVSDIIRLNAVYDAASLQKNEYTGLFFEEGVLVARTCYSGCKVTIPLCAAGITGASNNTECYTAAAVTP